MVADVRMLRVRYVRQEADQAARQRDTVLALQVASIVRAGRQDAPRGHTGGHGGGCAGDPAPPGDGPESGPN